MSRPNPVETLLMKCFAAGYNAGLSEAISVIAGARDDGWEPEYEDWHEDMLREEQWKHTNPGKECISADEVLNMLRANARRVQS